MIGPLVVDDHLFTNCPPNRFAWRGGYIYEAAYPLGEVHQQLLPQGFNSRTTRKPTLLARDPGDLSR